MNIKYICVLLYVVEQDVFDYAQAANRKLYNGISSYCLNTACHSRSRCQLSSSLLFFLSDSMAGPSVYLF